jgi:hypothetical protein
MKSLTRSLFVLLVIFSVLVSGCVAPPKPGSSSSGGPGSSGGSQIVTTPTNIQYYVTEVTPYVTGTTMGQGYTTFAPTTQVPEDRSCLIYLTQCSEYNGTAFTFDLKNPPMYINYSVVPSNITVTKIISSRSLEKGSEEVITLDTYSPYSWFKITVRSNSTKEIYQEDGFGKAKGFPEYLTRTLKVMKRDDLQIDLRCNNISATAGIWVKPAGNFDNYETMPFAECTYFDHPRDLLAQVTATTSPSPPYT